MLLSRRAARTHLVVSRLPKYFLRLRNAGSVSPGSGRPVRRELGYGPAVRLKPFRPHLTVGALSCALQPQRAQHAPTARTPKAAGAHPGGFPHRRPSPAPIEPHLHPVLNLRSSCARRGITPAFGYGPRLGSVRLDFHQLATRPARRAIRPLLTSLRRATPSRASPSLPTRRARQARPGIPGHPQRSPRVRPATFIAHPPRLRNGPLMDIGLRLVVQTRPDRPALYAQPTNADKAPMRHVFLGSRLRTPASSPPSLTTERLPSACGWCHQPPQGTRTPELLVMSRAHQASIGPAFVALRSSGADVRGRVPRRRSARAMRRRRGDRSRGLRSCRSPAPPAPRGYRVGRGCWFAPRIQRCQCCGDVDAASPTQQRGHG